ncbi:MAG TPA: PHP domain-containing protein, partial [Dongiaceae bacterium]|nr:PHP domain-containing protein [Dongiaceae bacterium]
MPHADFVHLRVHSAYSLSEGAIRIKALIELCRRHAMPAVAVTDSGNLFGALEFALAARDAGVQPIIGCQLAIARETASGGFAPAPAGAENGQRRAAQRRPPDQLVVLVQSEAGYRNLLRLVSKSFLDGEPGEAPQLPPTA